MLQVKIIHVLYRACEMRFKNKTFEEIKSLLQTLHILQTLHKLSIFYY
jgi:hypothetical protein